MLNASYHIYRKPATAIQRCSISPVMILWKVKNLSVITSVFCLHVAIIIPCLRSTCCCNRKKEKEKQRHCNVNYRKFQQLKHTQTDNIHHRKNKKTGIMITSNLANEDLVKLKIWVEDSVCFLFSGGEEDVSSGFTSWDRPDSQDGWVVQENGIGKTRWTAVRDQSVTCEDWKVMFVQYSWSHVVLSRTIHTITLITILLGHTKITNNLMPLVLVLSNRTVWCNKYRILKPGRCIF